MVINNKDEKVSAKPDKSKATGKPKAPVKPRAKPAAMTSIAAAAKVREQKEKLLDDISDAIEVFREAIALGFQSFSPWHSYSGGFASPVQEEPNFADGQSSCDKSAAGLETQSDSTALPASDADGWSVAVRSRTPWITSDQKIEHQLSLDADDELQKWADCAVDYSSPDPLAPGVPVVFIAVTSKSKRDRACADFAEAIYLLPDDCKFKGQLVAILRAAESATWENVASGRSPAPTPLIEKLLDDIETERRLNSCLLLKKPRGKNGAWVAGALVVLNKSPDIHESEIAIQFGISPSTVGRNKEFQKAKEVIIARNSRELLRGTKFKGNTAAAAPQKT